MAGFKGSLIDLPPVWLAGFLVLAWGIGRLVPLDLFGLAGAVAGVGLVVAGVGLMLAAAFRMQRHRTTVIPHRVPTALVTDGVFRLSRNPIYLADAMILAGAILWWRVPLMLILVPLFMRLIRDRFILAEEARLRAGFGPAFEAWAARTRRWL